MVANGGFEVAFHGEYLEIVPEERIAHTEVFEMPRAPSRQVRDAIMDSGMEAGMQEQMDVLEELARSLR